MHSHPGRLMCDVKPPWPLVLTAQHLPLIRDCSEREGSSHWHQRLSTQGSQVKSEGKQSWPPWSNSLWHVTVSTYCVSVREQGQPPWSESLWYMTTNAYCVSVSKQGQAPWSESLWHGYLLCVSEWTGRPPWSESLWHITVGTYCVSAVDKPDKNPLLTYGVMLQLLTKETKARGLRAATPGRDGGGGAGWGHRLPVPLCFVSVAFQTSNDFKGGGDIPSNVY